MSLLNRRWILKNQDSAKSVKEKLLENRGIVTSEEELEFYMEKPWEHIHDPFLMSGMEEGLTRIDQALEQHERIVVFGDYDADGVTSTAILVRTLKLLGAEVSYRIPHRLKDGYSLKNYFLDELKDLGVKLLITVDNGIAAAREISYAAELGMDIIVTDHHTPPAPEHFPKASAILNPKIAGCAYPFKELSGAGVAMKLCEALLAQRITDPQRRQAFLEELYQITAIGLIADCMLLIGENRAYVKLGLEAMKKNPLRGLAALAEVAGVDLKNITATGVAFMIAPRLNAAGRLDSAYDALHIFLNQTDSVKALADKLHGLNADRRTMTDEFTIQAKAAVGTLSDDEKIVIVASPEWNAGINGLIASRLVDFYARPVIILSEKDGMMVASCRSIPEFNIIEAVTEHASFLQHFGGHVGAAGFSLQSDRYAEFKSSIETFAREKLASYIPQAAMSVECDVLLSELSWETFRALSVFEPFGLGNPYPVFRISDVALEDVKHLGQEGKHLSFMVNGLKAVAFGFGHFLEELKGKRADLAFSLEKNEWKGTASLQVRVVDMHVLP